MASNWKRFAYVILIGLSGKKSSFWTLKVSVCSLWIQIGFFKNLNINKTFALWATCWITMQNLNGLRHAEVTRIAADAL